MRSLVLLAVVASAATLYGASPASFGAQPASPLAQGIGNVATQTDAAFAASFTSAGVTNVFATTQKVSCYRPEVAATDPVFNDGPNDGYSGESACSGAATTGEDTGAVAPYPTQVGSNPGYPMSGPQLVKDHSESDIRVDPTNPMHLIGSSKWIVSPEGYNHQLGFYESFNGGASWTVQGHIPGYEGWSDDTDPVGAFDGFGNYYELNLPYQFIYNGDGSKSYTIGKSKESNPVQPAEVISASVRPSGSTSATQWLTTHNGQPDFVATYDSIGNEPDKQWLTIDTNPSSPHYNRIYAMWVDFRGPYAPVPFVSYAEAHADGTHTDWSTPQRLPLPPHSPQGATYLLPHVDPKGVLYTTITNEDPSKGSFASTISVDRSTDGGQTWSVVSTPVNDAVLPSLIYSNTTFRDGITDTFAVGNHLDPQGHQYPLYIAWEDASAGVVNTLMIASYDGGDTWTTPIQVNDNVSPVDEFQPNLTVAANGTVSVAFYDRRLACPAAGTAEAVGAGIALDQAAQNPDYAGPVPPYGATNYCINAAVQFYNPALGPLGHNIRLTQHTWDPQLNSPHPGSPTGEETFIGDYFGNITSGSRDITTSVSTYNDGTNPANQQQQVIATVAVP
jgi:hypothetical protein